MCREHWAMAAFDLKYFVKSAYYGPGLGSPEHQEACDRAIADVNAKLLRS